ncbi:MAG: ABC transporter substrate-binding protein [Proteobacteria bacterium]|nr:ABC transporter substrate-binding protein [Pseudomonadota bacterium]
MRRRTLLTGGAATLLATPAIGQGTRAGTLRFVPAANLGVLDPIWSSDPVTATHACYVYDTLYGMNARMQPSPQMADGHDISADGRVWRIRLRDGLRFHDGEPVRAIDCVASLQRWAAKKPFGQLLAQVVDAWAAADDHTIELRLTRPFPLMLEALGAVDAPAYVMPERVARLSPDAPLREVVGSGPYRFVAAEYNNGSRAVYEKFDAYIPRPEPSQWTAGGKVAHYRRIEWHVMPDSGTTAAALTTGEVDWWDTPTPDLLPMLAGQRGIALAANKPQGSLAVLRFNCVQPPFNNPAMRRAVRLAVHQPDYMQAAFGAESGLWTTCPSLWPRNTPYYTEADAGLMPGDRAAAQAALKEAGYGGERIVVLASSDRPLEYPVAHVTADLLRGLGMTVDVQSMDFATMVHRRTSREPVDKGGWHIFHAATLTASLCGSPATSYVTRGPGRAGWFGWWSNPEVEALAQDWAFAPDDTERHRVAARTGHIALDEAASIPLGQSYERTAFRTSITGILPGNKAYPWNVRPA